MCPPARRADALPASGVCAPPAGTSRQQAGADWDGMAERTTDSASSQKGELVRLGDGSEILIRPIQPSDKARLLAGFEELSPRSRYRRFLSPMTRLQPRWLDYLTAVDHQGHEALIATSAGAPVGVPATSGCPRTGSQPKWRSRSWTPGREEGSARHCSPDWRCEPVQRGSRRYARPASPRTVRSFSF